MCTTIIADLRRILRTPSWVLTKTSGRVPKSSGQAFRCLDPVSTLFWGSPRIAWSRTCVFRSDAVLQVAVDGVRLWSGPLGDVTRRVIWPLLSQYVCLLAMSGSSSAGWTLPSASVARDVIGVLRRRRGAPVAGTRSVQANSHPALSSSVAGCQGPPSIRTSTRAMGGAPGRAHDPVRAALARHLRRRRLEQVAPHRGEASRPSRRRAAPRGSSRSRAP